MKTAFVSGHSTSKHLQTLLRFSMAGLYFSTYHRKNVGGKGPLEIYSPTPLATTELTPKLGQVALLNQKH